MSQLQSFSTSLHFLEKKQTFELASMRPRKSSQNYIPLDSVSVCSFQSDTWYTF